MKKLMQRFFGIVASAALLVTSGLTGFAADPGHDHGGGDKITSIPSGITTYTITLTHPEDKPFESPSSGIEGAHYGAYQIFSGTVKGTSVHTDPGNTNIKIPITDIKWGNAFGITDDMDSENKNSPHVSLDDRRKNIVSFVYALAKAPTGSYSYAFSEFNDFEKFFNDNKLNSDYVEAGFEVEVTLDTDGKTVASINNLDAVKYDKLAVAIADIIADKIDREWLQAFNDILGGYGQGSNGEYLNQGYVNRFYEGKIKDGEATKYEITVPAGYYMVRDLSGFEGETDKSYSARLLFVADNVTQELKESVPELDKYVVRTDGKLYETEAAGVGDDVKFRLTGTLPDNYDLYLGGYQYKFTDTLSKGLTLKELPTGAKTYVTVKVENVYNADGTPVTDDGGKIYTIDKDSFRSTGEHPTHNVTAAYTEEYDTNGGKNELTVTFPCLKEIVINKGTANEYYLGADSQIYVDYTAVVNQNAIVNPESDGIRNGNQNKAVLTYSDNPQSYGDTDETTPDDATVYTFGLDIVKVDAAEFLRSDQSKAALDGAKFAVVRPKASTLDNATGEATANTQWEIAKFKTVDADAESTENLPASFKTNGYYTITEWVAIENDGEAVKSATFDEDWLKKYTDTEYNIASLKTTGALNISGLNDGVTYTIVETATPGTDGKYAKIDPFTVTLTADTEDDEYTGKLSAANVSNEVDGKSFSYENFVQLVDPNGKTPTSDDNGSANMLVANFKYTDLPSTGGTGKYLFYIFGGGIVALSGVLFFLSRKKKSV